MQHLEYFGHQVGLRVDLARVLTPVLPEGMGDAIGDIESPTINTVARIAIAIGIHPALGGGEDVFLRSTDKTLFILTQFGQFVAVEPALMGKAFACFGITP